MRYLITILVCVSFIFSSNSYGQNQYPDKNRFKITAGELIKHFPDKGHGGASRKLFFKDTTFTLDYMNFYSISNDSSLVVIRWFNKNGESILCTYDTLGNEILRSSNVAQNPRSIVLFNNGYYAVWGGDKYEFPSEYYFYIFDNKGNLFHNTRTLGGMSTIISPPEEGNLIALLTIDSSSFSTPTETFSSRIDLIQGINNDPYILSSDIFNYPKNIKSQLVLHLKHDLNEIIIVFYKRKRTKLHSLNFKYDSKSIRKAKKYSKTIRHNR